MARAVGCRRFRRERAKPWRAKRLQLRARPRMVDAKRAGGRKAKGTVVKLADGRLQGIVTVHGKRKRLKPFPKGTSEAMAEERTAANAQKFAALPAPKS